MDLKLFKPFVSWQAKWNVLKTLSSGYLAEGEQVKQFEYEFGKKFALPHVVALNSGTSALELAYELAGLVPGDECITSVFTCTATNIPLVRRGVKLVFADIGYDLNMSVDDVKKKITPKTKAIVFVHFGGNNRGLQEIHALCTDKKITLIEDAAQAVGSDYWGIGDFTCVSLQAIKTLTSGDGGFLCCKYPEDMMKARRLRWFGYDRAKKKILGDTDIQEAGYKYHMNDVTASIGLGNLKYIDEIMDHRQKLRNIYKSYGMFAYSWLAGGFTENYEILKSAYAMNGIEIGQHHYPNTKYSIFKEFDNHDTPVMEEIKKKYFFVPYHHGIAEKQAHKIAQIYDQIR